MPTPFVRPWPHNQPESRPLVSIVAVPLPCPVSPMNQQPLRQPHRAHAVYPNDSSSPGPAKQRPLVLRPPPMPQSLCICMLVCLSAWSGALTIYKCRPVGRRGARGVVAGENRAPSIKNTGLLRGPGLVSLCLRIQYLTAHTPNDICTQQKLGSEKTGGRTTSCLTAIPSPHRRGKFAQSTLFRFPRLDRA